MDLVLGGTCLKMRTDGSRRWGGAWPPGLRMETRVAEVPDEVLGRTLTEGQQRMFTHVMVGANDLAASKKFYDAVLVLLSQKVAVDCHWESVN